MNKTVSSNQASLIFCIFTIGLKLSALPSLMYTFSGNDSYITCLIALIFDFIGTLIVISIMHRHPDLTFREFLTRTFGKAVSTIAQIILLVYFFGKCVLVLQELHDYFIATLFEELNPLFFLIVLGLIIMYSTTKNFRCIGRVAELIFWPTLIGIIFTLIFPIEDLLPEKLLPIFEQGFHPIYTGLSRTTFAFGDYMILFPLMGHIAYDHSSKKKMLGFATSAFIFIFAFFVIFVGSFGKYSMSQTLALGELPLHNSTPATIGKLEWLTIMIWTVILLADGMVLAIAGKSTFDNILGFNDKKWTGYVFSIGVIATVLVTYMQLQAIIAIATTPVFSGLSGILQTIFVIMLIIANIKISRNNKPTSHQPLQPKKTKRKASC